MFKKITLKNGLRIIVISQKGTQAATVLALVGTGSKYEKKEENGISHFLEHMFFKGTKKRPDKIDIAETLDKIGGIYNAFTGEDYTGYFAKVSASNFELALDWVSDIYLNSLLPEKEMEKEKGVIIEEINMIYDHPMSYVSTLWNKLLYGDQPAGWDIAGTKESVSGISRQELLDYMNSQYVASNTIVCLAGNINIPSAIEKIKKYFSSIKSTKPFEKPRVIERQTSPELLLHTKNTDQSHICFGARSYNVFHPQKYAQDLLAVILGGMMSSRLFISIRERQGLAYYIRASSELYTDSGYLSVHAGVKNDSAEQAVRSIIKECKSLREKAVGAKELSKAKEYIKGKTQIHLESSDAVASFWGEQEVVDRKTETVEEIMKAYSKVTVRDIKRVANIIFRNDRLNLAIIGPISKSGGLQKILTF